LQSANIFCANCFDPILEKIISHVYVQLEHETQKLPSVSGANKGWIENCLMFNNFFATDNAPGHPQNLRFAKLNINNYHHLDSVSDQPHHHHKNQNLSPSPHLLQNLG